MQHTIQIEKNQQNLVPSGTMVDWRDIRIRKANIL